MGEIFTQEYGDKDVRLRVIFDNGTENNMLRRSLQRALHKDEAGRRITEPTFVAAQSFNIAMSALESYLLARERSCRRQGRLGM